jgi:DNA adenine methylase
MTNKLAQLLPDKWCTYFEPMAGAAALFFASQSSPAVLADINSELINFYSILKSRPIDLIRGLTSLTASRDQYYAFRASRPREHLQRAIRFAYLNRLAWNGLYRVNRRGDFNVPIGDRLPANMWDAEELLAASRALSSAQLISGDFRKTARRATADDFVFFDPPYPRGARDRIGFNRYSRHFFTEDDHRDLARIIGSLTDKSVKVMVTLAKADHLDGLYSPSMRRTTVTSKALIACNGTDRRSVGELILTNY